MELKAIKEIISNVTHTIINRDLDIEFMGYLLKVSSYRSISEGRIDDSENNIMSIIIPSVCEGVSDSICNGADVIKHYKSLGIDIYQLVNNLVTARFKDDLVEKPINSTNEDLVKENERLTKELISDNSDFRAKIQELSDANINLLEENTKLKAMLDFNLNVEEAQNTQYQNAIKEAKYLRSRLDRVKGNWIKVSPDLEFTIKQHADTCKGYEDELAKAKSTISGLEGELSWHQASLFRHKVEIIKVNEVKDSYYKLLNDRGVTIELLNKRVSTLNSELDNCVTKLKSYEEQKVVVKPTYPTDFISHVDNKFFKYYSSLSMDDKIALIGGNDIFTEFQDWLDIQNG